MAATFTHLFSFFVCLFLLSLTEVSGKIPLKCRSLECPSYDVIQVGKDYEIRRYNSTVLISNSPVQGDSLVRATRNGFIRLFAYIHGDNKYKQQIDMTAPVITQVTPKGGVSSFVVSFYVPKKYQANPPPANGLKVQKLQNVYAAVRQFGGFVSESKIRTELAALNASLASTKWVTTLARGYNVAQFNAPFELLNRTNEIWLIINP